MSALIRIGLRYGAAILVARGFIGSDTGNMLATDPELAASLEPTFPR